MPGTAKDSLDQGIQQKRIESFFKKTPLAKRKERSSPMPFGSSRVKRKRDLQSCLRENSRDDDEIEIVISDSEPDPCNELPGSTSDLGSPKKKTAHRAPLLSKPFPFREPRALNDTEGMYFDFSADPKLASVQKTLISIVDPEGKSSNPKSLQSYVAAASAKIVDEMSSSKAPKSSWKPGAARKGLASLNDFKTASGKPVVSEMHIVVQNSSDESNSDTSSSLSTNSKTQTFNKPRFMGNRPVPKFKPPSRANSVGSSAEKIGMNGFPSTSLVETWAADGRTGLAAHPLLKQTDKHIINLIESEIMSLEEPTTWADVAGLAGPKKILKEIVVWPFLRPDIFKGIRAPPKGVLLFGPPGTGKTMIGRCVASQCRATFFNISASSMTSKWVGEGEKLVRALFTVARIKLPSVIFIDEIDSLLSSRSESEHESSRRIKTEFLVQLDGVSTSKDERLLVLAATNRPYELDEAARRRFAKRLYISLPEQDSRVCIVKRLMEGVDHSLKDSDYSVVAEITQGYSGADMHQLCAEAALGPIRDADNSSTLDIETVDATAIRPISLEDFRDAARVVRASVVDKDLIAYADWDKTFGCLI